MASLCVEALSLDRIRARNHGEIKALRAFREPDALRKRAPVVSKAVGPRLVSRFSASAMCLRRHLRQGWKSPSKSAHYHALERRSSRRGTPARFHQGEKKWGPLTR